MDKLYKDFELFARDKGIGSNKLDGYTKYNPYNGIIEPYILEERTLNCAPMSVFSRLMYDKIIFLGTGINDDVANIITAQLLYLNSVTDKDEDIKLFINSGGGSIDCGMAILDIMDFVDPDVSTYCIGTCASMAAVLLSSGAQGKRFSLPHSKTMIHQPMSSVGPYTQESDFKIAYDELKKAKADREIYLADVKKRNDEYQASKSAGNTTASAPAAAGGFDF